MNKQIKIREILGWKKYVFALLLCGYMAVIIGRIPITLLPKEIRFLIVSQIITTTFFLLFVNKHLYEWTIKNGKSRYKKFKNKYL